MNLYSVTSFNARLKIEISRSLFFFCSDFFFREDRTCVFRIVSLLIDEEDHIDHIDEFHSKFRHDDQSFYKKHVLCHRLKKSEQ